VSSMYPAPRTPHPTRRGFTLVEILVTITILGMMASMLLLAVQAANNSAKVAKTKATIAKINHFVMLRYDSYRTRRLAINVINYVASNSAWYPSPSISNPAETLTHQLARARVNAIRDLMRMEMPDRWTDIQPQGKLNQVPLIYDPSVTTPVAAPSITQRYLNAYNSAPTTPDLTFQSAQLLYMIVMSDSEAPHQFATNEIGTVDGSGLRVFLDGWGNPIFFLRWPAGFLPSVAADPKWGIPAATCDTDLQTGDYVNDHDPFDPNRVSPPYITHSGLPPISEAYAIYPLIYSAGPDGYADINPGSAANGAVPYTLVNGDLNPYAADPRGHLVGRPNPSSGLNGKPQLSVLSHYDNIHNQHVEAK